MGRRSPRQLLVLALLLLSGFCLGGRVARLEAGELLLGKDQALALAFPGATLEAVDLFLTPEEVEAVEKESWSRLESSLQTLYQASREGEGVGFAYLDTRTVRTRTATTLVALAPDGTVRKVLVCAFHEPREYLPVGRWFERLAGLLPTTRIQPGVDVAAITGATLSVRSFSAGVRQARALLAAHRRRAPGGS